MQVIKSPEVADVVVIGSGAGGGTAVQVLTEHGIDVVLLEAGGMIDPLRDFKEHVWPHDVPHRGAHADASAYFGEAPYNYFAAPNGFWEIEGEPFTVADGNRFMWFRSRVLGGRTNHWGRISLRFSDYDFEPYSTDGLGVDWPISYEEMAPYYEKVERFVGITGSKEGLRTAPDGVFQTPPPPKVHETLIKESCDRLGIPCIPNRRAVITEMTNGRRPCHYCGQCWRGCKTASNYSSSNVQILPAMRAGKVQVITGAMAREIVVGEDGRVTGVSYVDKASRTERQIRCRALVLAASACESARLLLNSKSSRFPDGVANGSGQVGRNLMDTVGFELWGHVPAMRGMPRYNSDGAGGGHLYVPWWLQDDRSKGFPRGYHIELGGGFGMPGLGSFQSVARRHGGYGADLKKEIRDSYGSFINLAGRGEMIPNPMSYAEIDPEVTDDWGIPVLRFHFQWTDYEWKQARHMERTFVDIIEKMGGEVGGISNPGRDGEGISVGGSIIHELGTARMGDDARSSVFNRWCQAHEIDNLFIADAAPFVSCPDKNPTLTIQALAWRTSDYLAEQLRQGNV